MGRTKPGEIVEWAFVMLDCGKTTIMRYARKESASYWHDTYKDRGFIVGPIARHVTRAPWMAKKGKEKKPEGA